MGAQRSGTSWWFALLEEHPEVRASPVGKELHFFDAYWRCQFTAKDIELYHRYFPRPAEVRCGEWTPRYSHDFWVPPLLAMAAAETSILMMLRDPIERFRSALGFEPSQDTPLSAVLAGEAFAKGLYHQSLLRMRRAFPSHKILILQYERCRRDPRSELRRTYEFLDLSDCRFVPSNIDRKVNIGPRRPTVLPAHLLNALREAYRDDVVALAADGLAALDLSLWPNFTDIR